MLRTVAVFGLVLAISAVADAQQVGATSLFEQGRQLYQTNCALCHRDSGVGNPPTFSALNGNEQLADAARIVTNIHQGAGTMPAFPDLTAEDIASLATYVRGAWENDYGSVTTEEVVAVLGGSKKSAKRHRSGMAYSPQHRRSAARRCTRARVAHVTGAG